MPNSKFEIRNSIVVIGGGFAGLRCALDLARCGGRNVLVTLVDKSPYHTYYPAVYEIAAAQNQTIAKKLRDRCCFSLAEICAPNGISFLPTAVQNVDTDQHHVVLEKGSPISYDYLVVALGSVSNDFGITGVREHGLALREAEAALTINERLTKILQGSHDGGRVVVGGGGVTGVEVAAELIGSVRRRCRQKHDERGCLQFTLIEALPQILSGLDRRVVKRIERRLERLGIKIVTGCAIKEVTATKTIVECAGKNEPIPFDLFIWTAGVKPAPVTAALPHWPHDRKGKLDVDEFLRVKGQTNIFAIGDSARFSPHDEAGRGLLELAQVAIAEGAIAAKNIRRTIARQPLIHFTPPPPRFIIPVGSNYAAADFGFLKLSGRLAHQLKSLVFLKYLLSIFSFRQAIKRWR